VASFEQNPFRYAGIATSFLKGKFRSVMPFMPGVSMHSARSLAFLEEHDLRVYQTTGYMSIVRR
jgi:hypothetical protein